MFFIAGIMSFVFSYLWIQKLLTGKPDRPKFLFKDSNRIVMFSVGFAVLSFLLARIGI